MLLTMMDCNENQEWFGKLYIYKNRLSAARPGASTCQQIT